MFRLALHGTTGVAGAAGAATVNVLYGPKKNPRCLAPQAGCGVACAAGVSESLPAPLPA